MSTRNSSAPRLWAAVLALGLAACIGLAGCADDEPEPGASPPASPELVAVPNVQGLNATRAVEVLCDAGFNVDVTQSVDSSLNTGSLSGESAPRGGSETQPGTTVVLQVFSRGDGKVALPAPDGCATQVVEVVDQPGGGTYGGSP